jgi:hypothetical protein
MHELFKEERDSNNFLVLQVSIQHRKSQANNQLFRTKALKFLSRSSWNTTSTILISPSPLLSPHILEYTPSEIPNAMGRIAQLLRDVVVDTMNTNNRPSPMAGPGSGYRQGT